MAGSYAHRTSDQPPALGAHVEPSRTTFTVFSSSATAIDLCLLDADSARRTTVTERRIPMTRDADNWGATAPVGPGQRYGFRAHGTFDPAAGLRHNPAKLLLDPYAAAIEERDPPLSAAEFALLRDTASDGSRCPIDTLRLAPWSVVQSPPPVAATTRPAIAPGERVIYEAHLGHLTALLPDVDEKSRGTFSALRSPYLIAHLKRIGVTTLELLPVAHGMSELRLLEREMRNVWGYNPMGFFAPAPLYCRADTPSARWAEIASAVHGLHEAGIEVLLDVVFNHSAEGQESDPTLHLRGLDNLAYYRTLENDPARYLDVTGCGNTLDTSRSAASDLVVAALRHWVRATDIDGFRFDLATTLGREPTEFRSDATLLQRIGSDPLLADRLLIAEPWDLGRPGYQLGHFPVSPGWAEWNDRFRDAVRDFYRPNAEPSRRRSHLASALAGSSDFFDRSTRRATASVNFVTAHDGFTLRDLVSYNHKHNLANGEDDRDGTTDNRSWNDGIEGSAEDAEITSRRLRRQSAMLATLLLSVGTPMLTAGDERNRTQRGNNNPYCLDAPWLAIDWSDKSAAAAYLTGLVAALTEIRRRYADLFDGKFLQAPNDRLNRPVVQWLRPDGAEITEADWATTEAGLTMLHRATADRKALLMLFNGESTPVTTCLPQEPSTVRWSLLIDTSDRRLAGPDNPRSMLAPGEDYSVEPFSVVGLSG